MMTPATEPTLSSPFTLREGAPAINRATLLTELPWEATFSYVSLENVLKLYVLYRVARQPTRLDGIAFYHVNGSCRAIPANRDKINRANMAARGDLFSR